MAKYKKYKDYDEYKDHQKKKANVQRTRILDELKSDEKKLKSEFESIKNELLKTKVLCLGARTGLEVKILRDLGFADSIGVDLNISLAIEEGLVEKQDFHNLSYEDSSFDNVYTNAIDHCFDITKVVSEITRVLTPNGKLIIRCPVKSKPGEYESFFWKDLDDLKEQIAGFNLIKQLNNTGYKGQVLLIFEKI